MILVGVPSFVLYEGSLACKQWYNVSKAPSAMKRYGHTAIATDNELYVFGGFDGKMLNDVFRFSPGKKTSYFLQRLDYSQVQLRYKTRRV